MKFYSKKDIFWITVDILLVTICLLVICGDIPTAGGALP